MVLAEVTLGVKENDPGYLHQHSQSSDPLAYGSDTNEHQASNEGVPRLVGIQNC